MSLLGEAVAGDRLVVAIDPGKVECRVWLSTGERGLLCEPLSLPTSRRGLAELERLVARGDAGAPLIALEQTGALHRAWQAALEQRWPGALRVFAPSETQAARAQLGSRRMKTDDRDCAALTWLARQGAGRPALPSPVEALQGAVRHRRQLVDARRPLRQRLHDQLNALCPGLSAPAGHGRELALDSPTGLAVLACAAAFAGRPASTRSLRARAPGRLSEATASFWARRWKGLLAPPADAEARARRLGRDLERFRVLEIDVAELDTQIAALLAATAGQVLATLPGVATIRAATFAAFTLPVERFASAEHLYAATGLAPATYQSSTVTKRGAIRRTGLPEHRDALMGIAWGLSQHSEAFGERDRELRARGKQPIEARVALARHACRLAFRLLSCQQPYDENRYLRSRRTRGR
ncbi:MAG: IS110 family transposase [Actinobacteria bacterium]|nr:IS110 family transposase [Actinomycetota bacterium]